MKPLFIISLSLMLSACNDSNTPNTSSNTSSATDITNVYFTNQATNCAEYAKQYKSSVTDVNRSLSFDGSLTITASGSKCVFNTNAIPNHNFDDGTQSFVNKASAQNDTYEVPSSPSIATSTTGISLSMDNAIFLNGVKLDLLAAGCYGIGNGKVGCHDANQPFRYDPMYSGNSFGTDSHNAHTQPDGTYHYHGNPMAMFYNNNSIVSPVIGFAADGFPIYGSYFDSKGTITKATSSYVKKSGTRAAVTFNGQNYNPGGSHDGTYVDDYEYQAGVGLLDECNGMTLNGHYAYYVTDTYPWVLGCFKGTPDASFNKR